MLVCPVQVCAKSLHTALHAGDCGCAVSHMWYLTPIALYVYACMILQVARRVARAPFAAGRAAAAQGVSNSSSLAAFIPPEQGE